MFSVRMMHPFLGLPQSFKMVTPLTFPLPLSTFPFLLNFNLPSDNTAGFPFLYRLSNIRFLDLFHFFLHLFLHFLKVL